MFDVISGLPVHALVIHAAVVLLPLMAVVTLAFTVRPRWRGGLPWAILGNVAGLGSAFVAKESGEALQARLSAVSGGAPVAADHAELGDLLPIFALGLLVASVVAYLLVRRTIQPWKTSETWDAAGSEAPRSARGAVAVATVLVLVAGGAASFWTYRVGHSGSEAVWSSTIENTSPPAG